MTEKWLVSLDQNGICAALLIVLFEAFVCLPQDLLITKLYACGSDLPLLKFLTVILI